MRPPNCYVFGVCDFICGLVSILKGINMKDLNHAIAFEEMNKARDKIYIRNSKIAKVWWEYWGSKRVKRAIYKGKYETWVWAPPCCASAICDILRERHFRFRTKHKNCVNMEVFINWA